MDNNNFNSFHNNETQKIVNLRQNEPSPQLLLLTSKNDSSSLQKVNHEISKISRNTQGKIPQADIVGKQIAEKNRGKWIFNGEANCWMVYELKKPGIWSQVKDYYVEVLINKELKEQEIAGYGSSSYINNIRDKIRMELIEMSWQENSPKKLLPFQNCVLEIATGNVLHHSPDYKFTWCLPRDFDTSSNEFPVINGWLDEVTNNNESIKKILLAYLAAIFKGRTDLQLFLHLIGAGGTGKSTFVRLAQMLVGDNNICITNLKDFCNNRFGTSNAFKKRLVVFPDQDRYRGDLQKFKSITGQDFIFAEEKGKQGFQFKFDGMVIMASNDSVFDTRNSSWLTRRQILVPFTKTIDKTKRRDLEKEFQPELNALTQYLLKISDETVTQILRCAADNPELAKHTLDHQINSNPIAAWIDECVIRDSSSKSPIGSDKTDTNTLFGSYTQWCFKCGSTAQSLPKFSPNLLDFCNSTLGWSDVIKLPRTNKGYFINGLRLRQLDKDDHIPSPLAVSVEPNLHSEEWGVAS
ncbi:DNA primase family protein [Mastigocladopsis repens]|uniref:DNA primase family protein n=1 Tax=Mastigocladopsis repens TaxID=221287 RepID=UPI0003065B0C|nr:phage/plasmid primase, P4 family [Mastigocladopsis repens]